MGSWKKTVFVLLFSSFVLSYVLPADVFARVGGSRSSGSRGSRSYTPPSRPSSPPTSPQPSPSQGATPSNPGTPSQPMQQPMGGMWRGIAGGLMGGMLGSMLFRGLGFGSDLSGGEGGIGLFEILIIAVLLYGVYWYFKRRRQVALAEAYRQNSMETTPQTYGTYGTPPHGISKDDGQDLAQGLSHLRQMDPSFDEKRFLDLCMDQFFRIQGAWANRDMKSVRDLMTDEMFGILQGDADKLKSEGKMNKLDNIAVRSMDVIEVWQESGKDFATVRLCASLLDYTIDEGKGQVLSGSKTEPVKFDEYWTFTRPVGNHPWQLTAINQPE